MITFDFYITLFVILVCLLITDQECSDILLRVDLCICTRVCITACVNARCVCVLWRESGMFFWESYPRPCSVIWLSPSLCSAKGEGTHQHVLYDRGPVGGQQVRGQVMGCEERVRGTRGQEREGLLSLHHSRTQQRQNLWRLPPTEGGGVTGAKYACTLMLGRWVCEEKRSKNK